MRYFLAVVPGPVFAKRVYELFPQLPLEPHITVKAQPGLDEGEQWIQKARQIISNTKPFPVIFTQPGIFEKGTLYLAVDSKELVALHRALVEAIGVTLSSQQEYFEGKWFTTPHLTLAHLKQPYDEENLLEQAGELLPAPAFVATYIRVYKKAKPNETYIKYLDIPLAK